MSDGRGKIAKQYTVHTAKFFWCQKLWENKVLLVPKVTGEHKCRAAIH